jgi:hypothetical protein
MSAGFESSVSAIVKKIGIGSVVEAAGAIIFLAGVVQLLHHAAIAACVVGGVVAVLAGKKLRAGN